MPRESLDAAENLPKEASWIVDLVGRPVEAYKLTDREYVLVGSVANQPAALPPFTDLQIDPAALWS